MNHWQTRGNIVRYRSVALRAFSALRLLCHCCISPPTPAAGTLRSRNSEIEDAFVLCKSLLNARAFSDIGIAAQ
jgi:hypothetical protein